MKNSGNTFFGISLILVGILGAIAKFYTHQYDWKIGSIFKLILILGAIVYGIIILVRKK